MPYRDKEKERHRNKRYYQKNKGLLYLKEKRRKGMVEPHSQGHISSLPDLTPDSALDDGKNVIKKLREKIKELEGSEYVNEPAQEFKDDYVIETSEETPIWED